jgi:hypothetical protein
LACCAHKPRLESRSQQEVSIVFIRQKFDAKASGVRCPFPLLMSVNGDETITRLGQWRKFFSECKRIFREARENFREGVLSREIFQANYTVNYLFGI